VIRRRDRKDGLVPRGYRESTLANPMAVMSDMDRIFDDFRSEWENLFLPSKNFVSDLTRQPLVDLADNGTEYIVKAEVPGLNKEDMTIEVTENGIEISGETNAEEKEEDKSKGYIRRERRYTSFYRSLPLPESILTEKVDAELKDGVLTVKLPKAAPPEKKTKKVKVK
jgi:HSP20 family protein